MTVNHAPFPRYYNFSQIKNTHNGSTVLRPVAAVKIAVHVLKNSNKIY